MKGRRDEFYAEGDKLCPETEGFSYSEVIFTKERIVLDWNELDGGYGSAQLESADGYSFEGTFREHGELVGAITGWLYRGVGSDEYVLWTEWHYTNGDEEKWVLFFRPNEP